jgi:hypothetical protein
VYWNNKRRKREIKREAGREEREESDRKSTIE